MKIKENSISNSPEIDASIQYLMIAGTFAGILKDAKGKGFFGGLHALFTNIVNTFLIPEISPEQIKAMEDVKGYLFLGDGCLTVIVDFKIVSKIKKRWFGKPVTRYYLQSVRMDMYDKKRSIWRSVANPPLYGLAKHVDFVKRRYDWLKIMESLYMANYEIVPSKFEHNDYY